MTNPPKARVDFPDGTHAILREKINVRGKAALERTSVPALKAMRRIRAARKAAERAENDEMTPEEMVTYTEEEIYAMQRMEFAGVLAKLAHWTREEPLPRTLDEIEDLEAEIYEPLALVIRPILWDLLKRPGTSTEDAFDPKTKEPILDSPTGPSNGSDEGDSGQRAIEVLNPNPSQDTGTENLTVGIESGLSGAPILD